MYFDNPLQFCFILNFEKVYHARDANNGTTRFICLIQTDPTHDESPSESLKHKVRYSRENACRNGYFVKRSSGALLGLYMWMVM